jgi:hypothetical protein
MEGYAGNTKWKQSRTGREDTGSTDEKDRTGRDNAIVRKQEKAGQNEMEHRGRARKKTMQSEETQRYSWDHWSTTKINTGTHQERTRKRHIPEAKGYI